MKVKAADSANFTIYIAGDIDQAKQVCREYCFSVGMCVTIDPTTYVYTGGEEEGVKVSFINYPRFPSTPQEIRDVAQELATLLMHRLCQQSFSIVGPEETYWFSRRDV